MKSCANFTKLRLAREKAKVAGFLKNRDKPRSRQTDILTNNP